MPWKTHGDARGKTMNEESITQQGKTLKTKRILVRNVSHSVICSAILAAVSTALLLFGFIIGVSDALFLLFIGAFGYLFRRKWKEMQNDE